MKKQAVILAAVASLSLVGSAMAASATLTFDDVVFTSEYGSTPTAYIAGYNTGLNIGGSDVIATFAGAGNDSSDFGLGAYFGSNIAGSGSAPLPAVDHTPGGTGALLFGTFSVSFSQEVYVTSAWVNKYFNPEYYLPNDPTIHNYTYDPQAPETYDAANATLALATGRTVTIKAYNGSTLVKQIDIAAPNHTEHWRLDQVAWREVIGLSDVAVTSLYITGDEYLPHPTAAAFLDDLTISDTAVTPLYGDFGRDGTVDDGDYTIWADTYDVWSNPDIAYSKPYETWGTIDKGVDLRADADGNGWVDDGDYTAWADSYGQSNLAPSATVVPEPASLGLIALGALAGLRRRRA